MPDERDQLARDLIASFPVLDKSDDAEAETPDDLQALRDVLYEALGSDWEIGMDGYRRAARAVADAGWTRYPTADAYEAACAALEKHRGRADGAEAQLADARHELDVLRGIAVDLEQRLDLALTDLTAALAERDQARAEQQIAHNALINARATASDRIADRDKICRDVMAERNQALGERDEARAELEQAGRDVKRWEDWAAGHKTTADGLRVQLDKAWAELDQVRGELAKTVSNFEEYAETTGEELERLRAANANLIRNAEILAGQVVELTIRQDATEAERDRRGDELKRAQDVIGQVRELHVPYEGRCIECVEYCDCLDQVKELGDDVEVAAAFRMCTHGNKPSPCRTVGALNPGGGE